MPKSLEEIKVFSQGIVSSPSSPDTPKESAAYSLNIDANSEQGALTGIHSSKVLTEKGWENPAYTEWTLKINPNTDTAFNDGTDLCFRNLFDEKWWAIPIYDHTYVLEFCTSASSTFNNDNAIEWANTQWGAGKWSVVNVGRYAGEMVNGMGSWIWRILWNRILSNGPLESDSLYSINKHWFSMYVEEWGGNPWVLSLIHI